MFETLWRHDGWGIGIVRAPAAALLAPAALPPTTWMKVAKPHTFVADPFLIREGGTTYCFFEELPYRSNRGTISYIALDEGDLERPNSPRAAIVAPHHLSYPFLLRHDGEILCVPEAAESGRIVAYAARTFPEGWYPKATLLEFPGVDPTIFRHEGRWWLLCTDGRAEWNVALHAFYADDLFGPWRPHEANPVVRDLAGGRPAGRPFTVADRLYRPAQNCSLGYGASLTIAEVTELTPKRFMEHQVAALVPQVAGPYPDGLHTVCAEGDLLVIDGNRMRFEPQQALRVLRNKVRSLMPAALRGAQKHPE